MTLTTDRPMIADSPTPQFTPAALLATPLLFQRWLDSKDAIDEVGRSQSAYHCPLAMYLQSYDVEAWVAAYSTGTQDMQITLPDWAIKFVELIDKWSPGPIRASHARALLHEAVRGS